MSKPLQHSNIALAGNIKRMARLAKAKVLNDEDDFDQFSYFDLRPTINESKGFYRFAKHDSDSYVHVLTDAPDDLDRLAEALIKVGIEEDAAFSISTNEKDEPLLDLTRLLDSLRRAARAQRVARPPVRNPNQVGTRFNALAAKRAHAIRSRRRPVTADQIIGPEHVNRLVLVVLGTKRIRLRVQAAMVGRRFGDILDSKPLHNARLLQNFDTMLNNRKNEHR